MIYKTNNFNYIKFQNFFASANVVNCDLFTIKVMLMIVPYKSDITFITIFHFNKLWKFVLLIALSYIKQARNFFKKLIHDNEFIFWHKCKYLMMLKTKRREFPMNVPSLQYLRPLRLNQCHCWRRRGPIPNPQSRWARLAVDGE